MTVAEKVRDTKIRELGCIACYVQYGVLGTPTSVHHITVRGRRKGHKHTIPLCPGHHKDGDECACKLPFHHNKKSFEVAYGTQEELFDLTNKLIGYTDEMIAAMSARKIKPETGLCQKATKKPRKTPVIKSKVAPSVVKFVAKAKRTILVPKKIPSRPLQNAKLPKPSPEMLARKKAAQKASKERYLKENAHRIEAVKRKAREKVVEVRRPAGKRGSLGKAVRLVSTKIVAMRPGVLY